MIKKENISQFDSISIPLNELQDILLYVFRKGADYIDSKNTEQTLSIREAAKSSGLSQRKIRDAVTAGKLSAVQGSNSKNSKIIINRVEFTIWKDTLQGKKTSKKSKKVTT
ncbi:MAG: hypothetical protein LBK94_05245 [Prevotellaceae bacterium]|jgi:hypothetical protein|nr:hypothetical protein [Prevotellaceae bacterium]